MSPPEPIGRRAALGVAFAWGFAEATLFVIVPDVWVGLVAILVPRLAIGTFLAACAGALAGTTALFILAPVAGTVLATLIASLPGLDPGDLAQVARELQQDGLVAVVRAPLAGMPIKVHALEAGLLGLPLAWLLVAVAVNRIVRIGLVAGACAIVGRIFAPSIASHRRRAVAIYAAFWVVAYIAYFASR